MVDAFNEGVTTNSAPAKMTDLAVSASSTVPAPNRILPPYKSATFSMTLSARGTVMVISKMETPPARIASTMDEASSEDEARTTGISPTSMTRWMLFRLGMSYLSSKMSVVRLHFLVVAALYTWRNKSTTLKQTETLPSSVEEGM